MKKINFAASLLSFFTITLVQFSCNTINKKEDNSRLKTHERLNISLFPSEEKTINYVDSISLKDSIILTENTLNDVKSTLKFYSDQEKFWWNKLERLEKEKFNLIQRLVEEVSYNKHVQKEELEYAKAIAKKIKAQFMMRSELQDTLKDPTHDKYLAELFYTCDQIKDIQNQSLYNELKQEIQHINTDLVLLYRTKHGDSVNLFNHAVDSLSAEIKEKKLVFVKVKGYY